MNDSVRAGVLQETFGGQWALADVVARLRVARMARACTSGVTTGAGE